MAARCHGGVAEHGRVPQFLARLCLISPSPSPTISFSDISFRWCQRVVSARSGVRGCCLTGGGVRIPQMVTSDPTRTPGYFPPCCLNQMATTYTSRRLIHEFVAAAANADVAFPTYVAIASIARTAIDRANSNQSFCERRNLSSAATGTKFAALIPGPEVVE